MLLQECSTTDRPSSQYRVPGSAWVTPTGRAPDYTPVAPEAVEAFLDAAQPVVDSLVFE